MQKQSIDTSTIIIGSISDLDSIYRLFDMYYSLQQSTSSDYNNNILLRTERSRERISREIKKVFLSFNDNDHEELLKGILSDKIPQKDKFMFLFWQFSLNNRLFREITLHVFMKTYYSGRIGISKEDIIGFLKDQQSKKNMDQVNWSERTITTVATKYLNFMTKLGFLTNGRSKIFIYKQTSSEALVIFLYFAKLYAPKECNILKNEFYSLSFIPHEDFQKRLKKLSLKGFFNMNFNGVALNIELTHSYKGICDALYN